LPRAGEESGSGADIGDHHARLQREIGQYLIDFLAGDTLRAF